MSTTAAQRFPKDIATHVATVKLDHGVFRYIECRRPGTYAMWFNITTWPGYLAITGDMGAYTFCRLNDMFAFFRSGHGRINPSYWSEKLVAIAREGTKAYSPDLFRRAVVARYKHWKEWHGDEYSAAERRELRWRIRDAVLSRADDGEQAAHEAAHNFVHDGHIEGIFSDFWETNLREYTFHFLWCCHAIVWAIAQYDALSATNNQEGQAGE